MKIEKIDVVQLMRKTVENNWFDSSMTTVSNYERAITVMSGGLGDQNEYEGREEDLDKIMLHIEEYSDFKIDNVYQIIYEYQPWNFMKYSGL